VYFNDDESVPFLRGTLDLSDDFVVLAACTTFALFIREESFVRLCGVLLIDEQSFSACAVSRLPRV
jgi:hypothetical protein